MSRKWTSEFLESSGKKVLNIFVNGNFENGKTLYIEPDWTLNDFLNAASQRLELVPMAKRIFSVDGFEIDDCMMVEDNDVLFFSQGDDFRANSSNILDSSNNESENTCPIIIGNYKVGAYLGKGGFGEVRVGEHQFTGEKVALKFLKKSEIASINAAERTTTEIQCLTTLKHQNIIRLQQVIYL